MAGLADRVEQVVSKDLLFNAAAEGDAAAGAGPRHDRPFPLLEVASMPSYSRALTKGWWST